MDNTIYTFWEGELPEYLKLCMCTWKFPFIILNYDNLSQYTEKIPEKVKQLSLQKVADYVRVHVLRDSGGIWLDTDTIMLSDKLPNACILGNNENRNNTIGYLKADNKNLDIFKDWALFQENVIEKLENMPTGDTTSWDIIGNCFTNDYLIKHKEIFIDTIDDKWVETYMITGDLPRHIKYKKFYFESNFTLNDIKDKTNMLMLHNSWTPDWYKKLSKEDVLKQNCTLSNILRELNDNTK